jgi:1,4-alpha-glucan branching enzyme
VCVCNFSDAPRAGYRVGLPIGGTWHELLNTDAEAYGGAGGGGGAVEAEERPWHEQPWSAELSLPPLGVLWLVPEGA